MCGYYTSWRGTGMNRTRSLSSENSQSRQRDGFWAPDSGVSAVLCVSTGGVSLGGAVSELAQGVKGGTSREEIWMGIWCLSSEKQWKWHSLWADPWHTPWHRGGELGLAGVQALGVRRGRGCLLTYRSCLCSFFLRTAFKGCQYARISKDSLTPETQAPLTSYHHFHKCLNQNIFPSHWSWWPLIIFGFQGLLDTSVSPSSLLNSEDKSVIQIS